MQDIRIVAIDRPGYGHSTFNSRGHFHTIAADVVQLIDHLGLSKVVVIGTSGEQTARVPGVTVPISLVQTCRVFGIAP